MDWKSSRIDNLLEQALIEDKAAGDTTTNLTIDPNLRATATILARQELVVCGLGSVSPFLEIFARLDKRDGKPEYLRHLPRIERYLSRNLAHPLLQPLALWYQKYLPRALGPPPDKPEP